MPCKIYLRHDQSKSDTESATKEGVTIFAPTWVQEGLKILGKQLNGVKFEVYEKPPSQRLLESFTLSEDISLIQLQKISRNETSNVTGFVRMEYYEEEIKDPQVVYSMRNLVRQCVIVGKDETTHYGGYPRGSQRVKQTDPVYICDLAELAALQFQQIYNSGVQVLICEKPRFEGEIEELIFERIVGHKKAKYSEVKGQDPEFVKVTSSKYGNCYVDLKVYKAFVANDVLLSGVALSEVASKNGDKLNFKFLKYGTGFFAGEFGSILNENILSGVIDGIELMFRKHPETLETIKQLEFTFYTEPPKGSNEDKRLKGLCKEFGVEYKFSRDDGLKSSSGGWISTLKSAVGSQGIVLTATTNCGDTHAVFGNEMGMGSVDGAIGENIRSRGNIFCPNLNKKISEEFLSL